MDGVLWDILQPVSQTQLGYVNRMNVPWKNHLLEVLLDIHICLTVEKELSDSNKWIINIG